MWRYNDILVLNTVTDEPVQTVIRRSSTSYYDTLVVDERDVAFWMVTVLLSLIIAIITIAVILAFRTRSRPIRLGSWAISALLGCLVSNISVRWGYIMLYRIMNSHIGSVGLSCPSFPYAAILGTIIGSIFAPYVFRMLLRRNIFAGPSNSSPPPKPAASPPPTPTPPPAP
jgi:hypothetical protein